MSTEMEEVKVYTATLVSTMRDRLASIEKLSAVTHTELSIPIDLPTARHITNMLDLVIGVASGLEKLADRERARAEAAESALVMAMAVNAKLRDTP